MKIEDKSKKKLEVKCLKLLTGISEPILDTPI